MGNKRRITAKKGTSRKSPRQRPESTDSVEQADAANNITRILDSSAEELAARLDRQREEARWREEDRQYAAIREQSRS